MVHRQRQKERDSRKRDRLFRLLGRSQEAEGTFSPVLNQSINLCHSPGQMYERCVQRKKVHSEVILSTLHTLHISALINLIHYPVHSEGYQRNNDQKKKPFTFFPVFFVLSSPWLQRFLYCFIKVYLNILLLLS